MHAIRDIVFSKSVCSSVSPSSVCPSNSATVYINDAHTLKFFHHLVGHYIVFERYAITKLQGELRHGR